MSDEIAVMNFGQLEQLRTATDIYEQPATEFVVDIDGRPVRVEEIDGTSGAVAVAVAPETVRIGEEAAALSNCFEGRVADEIYKGNFGTFVIELENGAEITVDMLIRDQGQYLSIGRRIVVGWDPENVVILTD
ncbi:MAG: TOBE domain-containing protein [Halobacteriota archaeon]